MDHIELEGVIVDIDYVSFGDRSIIRMSLKSGDKVYRLLDPNFYPYFYLNPFNKDIDPSTISQMKIVSEGENVVIHSAEKMQMSIRGKQETMLRISANNTRSIPRLSEHLSEFGQRYEYDILFWKRYLIDKRVSPLSGVTVKVHEDKGDLIIDEILPKNIEPKLTHQGSTSRKACLSFLWLALRASYPFHN